MRCIFVEIPGTKKANGWRKVRCVRKGCRWHGELNAETDSPLANINSTCDAIPLSHEWGHWLALILGAFFIDKRSWLWLKARLGFKPTCGCEARETWLNRIGHSLFRWRR